MSLILYSGWLSPVLCQQNPEKTFVFGDNLRGFGMGGQAVIRNQDNALGVPTKRKPAMTPGSFFVEGDDEDEEAVLKALETIWSILRRGGTVVIPVLSDGRPSLGLERAELMDRAPSIYAMICQHVEEMDDVYGGGGVVESL